MPSSSPAVLATVKWIEDQSWKNLPIYDRSKAAADTNYPKPDYQPRELIYYTVNKRGVGVVLGPLLGGPVDVDVDALDITDIIEAFFPATEAVFGRLSKPRSHRLYRVEATEFITIKYLDPLTKKMIFELRGDGGLQTVLPGSQHESGELVEWLRGAPPISVAPATPEELQRAGMLAVVCVMIRRYFWIEGMRDLSTHHVSALLFKLGWPLEDVKDVFKVAAGADFDRKAELRIERTYIKFKDGKPVSGAFALRKMKIVDPAVLDALCSWAGAPDVVMVNELNDRFAAGLVGEQFRIIITDVMPDESLLILAKKDFLDLTSAERVMITDTKGKSKLVSKAELWLNNGAKRKFSGLRFLPGVNDDDLPSGVINVWTGWPIAPDPNGSCSAWLDLLFNIICGGDDRSYLWVLNWLANIVREPMIRPLTSLVLISDLEGAGKTLLLTYFGKILGRGYVSANNRKHITSNFNRHLAPCLLLHSEEALYPGNHEDAASIRSLTTDPWRMAEFKYHDAIKVANFLRLAYSSNKLFAAAPQPSDRRHTALYLENRKAPPDLVEQVRIEMEGNGPAALFHLLLTMDYDRDLIRTNIKNVALSNLKQIAAEPQQQWWQKRLFLGEVLDGPDLSCCKTPHSDPWPAVVSIDALEASYKYFLRINNHRVSFNSSKFQLELVKMTNCIFHQTRPKFNYQPLEGSPQEFRGLGGSYLRQYAISNLPTLTDCRKAFELYLDPSGETTIDWPEINDNDEPSSDY